MRLLRMIVLRDVNLNSHFFFPAIAFGILILQGNIKQKDKIMLFS